MYCKEYSESFNDASYCDECEKKWECEERQRFLEQEKILKNQKQTIEQSEYFKKMKETLKGIFNLDDVALNGMLESYYKDSISQYDEVMRGCIKAMAQQMADKFFQEQASKRLNELFEQSLQEEILVLKDDKVIKSKVQALILERIKSFLSSKSSYNDRSVEKTLENVINNRVSKMFDEAFAELKAETIEKFNKETMKVMMAGMAKQIGSDKKLLTLLCD